MLEYFDYFLPVCILVCCIVLCACDCGALGDDFLCGKEGADDIRGFEVVGCDGEFSDHVRCCIDRSSSLAV